MSNKIIKEFALLALIIALIFAITSCNLSTITGFAVKEDKDIGVNETLIETTNATETSITETAGTDSASNETIAEIIANETIEEQPKEEGQKKEKPEEPKKEKGPNVPPVWKSDASEFVVAGKTTIDLNNYFYDDNNDTIAYASTTPEKISVTIENSLVTLVPVEDNLTTTIEFTASDGDKSTSKEVTLIVPERAISINLQYNPGTIYDADDNGYEATEGIIDFTVESSKFTWGANESNLCTRWDVYSVEDAKSTTVCYGSEKCCSFIGLAPTREAWNDEFYSTYGQYGATLSNIVSAQVIYVDYGKREDKPFVEIYYSGWQNLSADYYLASIDFENVCVETCILEGFNETSYKLIFEIDNAVLNLDVLTYSIAEEISKVLVNLEVKDDEGLVSGSYELYKNSTLIPAIEGFVEPGYYDIEVLPKENIIDKILIENANITKPVTASIGVDNVTREISIENVDVKKRYAVDLEGLEFEKATLQATASANALYKCRQWDYEGEVCFGEWAKVKDLAVGEAYNLTLTKEDPGFIEGNVNITIEPVNITPINVTEINITNATIINITELALIKDIPNITIIINKNATIDLNEYFSNIDENTGFAYFEQDGTSILFDESTATIMPSKGFVGTTFTYITATKGGISAISNVFSVKVVNVTIDITPELKSEKEHFELDEDADFDFEFLKKDELIEHGKWKEEYEVYEEITDKKEEELKLLHEKIKEQEKLLSEAEKLAKKQFKKHVKENQNIETFVLDSQGSLKDINVEIEELREGKFKIKLLKPRAFRAGKYTLKIDLVKDGITYTQQQDFTWGVLAINVNKSIYLPNQDAFIGIGVLDDRGKIVCDADVTLEITNPSNQKTKLTTANNDIKISPECTYLGVTQLPDYYTTYSVNGVGTYLMNLTAVTANGVRSIQDDFTVQSSVSFDVARQGPTRVYPAVAYRMDFTINANDDYSGPIIEYVPSSFAITPQNDIIVNTIGDTKQIIWITDLEKGKTYNIGYEFDAPDISPEFYLLGPLQIGTFAEKRNWQIANDAFVAIDAGWEGSAMDTTENDVTLTDQTTCLTNAVTGTTCVHIDAVGGNDNDLVLKVRRTVAPSTLSALTLRLFANVDGGAVIIYAYSTASAVDTLDSVSATLTAGQNNDVVVTTLIDNMGEAGQYSLRVIASGNAHAHISEASVEETVVDTIPPFFPTNSINNSNPKINEVVGIAQNATDAGSNIDMVIFAHNQSGLMRNVSNTSNINTKSINYTPNLTITLVKGNVIEYRFWANDTSTGTAGGNKNTTDATEIRTFTVANTPPVTPTISTPADDTEITVLKEGNPVELNVTFPADADNDAITIYYYIDGKLNQTSSVNTTLNASTGAYILNVSLSDGVEFSANATVNFTIILDTILPIVNASLNKSLTSIYSIDVLNLTANATDDLELSFGQIIINDTGFKRYFNFSLSGKASTFSQNISVSCDAGCIINFTARANDTSNNFRTNNTIIEVQNIPPEAKGLQCNNKSNWTACDVFKFKDIFEAVRLECTDDGPVKNVTFNFSNFNDGKTFFLANATKNEGDFWTLNNTDITITDSGTFNVTALCYDSVLATDLNFTSFELAFGVINITFITSNSSLNMTKDSLTDIEVNIKCIGGECGDVNATLDPFMQHYQSTASETIPKENNIGANEGAISTAKPLTFIKNIFQQDILVVSAAEENEESSKESILTRIQAFIKGLFAKETTADEIEEAGIKDKKTDFKADEAPEFDFSIEARGNLITGFATGIVEENVKAKLIQPNGKEIVLEEEVMETEKGVKIKLDKGKEFKPGLYKLIVETTINGVTTVQEQEFTWGVLAINVNKSIYLPNEDSFIGIGVLDDAGKIVCNADVTLEITNPLNQKTTLTTANNNIKISPECQVYGVTELPDYYTEYEVDGVGTYKMELTAVTKNGVRSIEDSFIVQRNVDFDVTRQGPTRIYPPVPYRMEFTINANKNYNGVIREYIPASFEVIPQDSLIITEVGDAKVLTWNVNLKKDDTIKLYYEFDAPDISPEFYLLGPLEIGSFAEKRNWQIASDATWSSKLLFSFDDDDGAPATYTAEILDSSNAVPNFDGTLTKFTVRMVIGTAANIDAGEGTEFLHCEDSGCADSYSIGSVTGTALTVTTYYLNSTDPALLARIQHDGVDSEFLRGSETADGLDGGENLNYDAYVDFVYADITPPQINASLNNSAPNKNDVVNMTANATDAGGLDTCNFYMNGTSGGSFIILNKTFSGGPTNAQCSQNFTIDLAAGSVINFTVVINDTSPDTAGGNKNQTQQILTVVDTRAPVINGTLNKSSTTIFTNDVINATFNTTDETGLSFGQVIINQTGSKEFFNFSLGTGNTIAQFSQKFTISCDFGCVINITGIANDTSNNLKQNETIFTVGEQNPPNVTLVSPENNAINTTDREIVFKYSVKDQSAISSCSLEINGKANNTVTSPAKETTNIIFGGNFSNADYNWSVSCSDTAGNANSSLNRTISIQYLNESKGIISTTIGATPFFARSSNPNSSCTALIGGNNCIVKWRVNASGGLNERYVFFAFANATNYSNNVYHNETVRINVTIVSEVAEAGPPPPVVDTTPPVINGSLNKSLSNILQNDVINATFNATDNINLTNGTIIINNTGFNRYFNFSLNGSGPITQQFSQNFTISEAAGTVVNITGVVSDNSSNVAQNETIFTIASANQPPIIKANNATGFAVDPIAGGNAIVLISFNVTDAQGVSDVNASKAVVNFTLGYESGQWRSNVSDVGAEFGTCYNHTEPGPGAEAARVIINCTVLMKYYDNASAWFINISVADISGAVGLNATQSFTYNTLSAISLPYTAINFSSVFLGQQDVLAYPHLLMNNTGNEDFDMVNMTAAALVGTTTTTENIAVTNFGVNLTNSSTNLRLSFPSDGIANLRDPATGGNASLIHGHTSAYSVIADKGNISAFIWVNVPSSGLSSQLYNATWNVTVVNNP